MRRAGQEARDGYDGKTSRLYPPRTSVRKSVSLLKLIGREMGRWATLLSASAKKNSACASCFLKAAKLDFEATKTEPEEGGGRS